jgi:hypothetical protein
MTARWIATALLLVASPLVGQAQEPVLEAGARVRVTAPEVAEEPLVGTYWGIKNGQLIGITRDKSEDPLDIRVSEVEGLEISTGKRGQGWKGAKIGFGVAALATAIPVGISCASDSEDGWCVAALVVYTPLAGLVGGVIGVAIGSSIRTDIWEPVELPAKPRVAVHPTGRFSGAVLVPRRRYGSCGPSPAAIHTSTANVSSLPSVHAAQVAQEPEQGFVAVVHAQQSEVGAGADMGSWDYFSRFLTDSSS